MDSSATNYQYISQGFQILLRAYAPYVAFHLVNEYGTQWWQMGVLGMLRDDQKRNLPSHGSDETLMKSLDIALCLLLLDLHWKNIFSRRLPKDFRTWSKELMGVRNRWAHAGTDEFNDNDTWRALDTMSRLCENMNPDDAEAIRSLLRESRYGTAEGSVASSSAAVAQPEPAAMREKRSDGILSTNATNLPCWRDVVTPHPDVAKGRYRRAEFAADLAQVARGEGTKEYLDPIEFFARTYVTLGMKDLLVQAVRRVCGLDGEPVIQLKTAFGGGKTHSMLALYHLLHGKGELEKIPAVRSILDAAGVRSIPTVHTAVLVGTALDPSHSKQLQNMSGITINTIWGEMAAQLALSVGDLKLYDYVKEADKKGVSPGSETLKRLFDACGSCLVLVDELVAYAKKIYGVQGLPAGSFDNFISFIQEVTEAARASRNSLVVASLPESEIEIGGEAGKIALETIEHTFGRMEAIWKPVAASEGFEIVRRRLFLDCQKTDERDMVCEHFSQLYQKNPGDFPVETRELEYKKRLIACYPIHPEVFDRLYEDWATLERFQRTRGVLRLMAAVIHELWMSQDKGLLIMPGSLPMDVANVRDELTRHLSEEWNGLVDKEVDGRKSIPYLLDKEIERYGRSLAARRVARTIMLGSAPSVRQQNVRGIETTRIRLGVVQPAEQIAVFNDALNSLQNRLTYLYTSSSYDRFWYDTRPTLRKTVDDRANQIAQNRAKIEFEIETRLKKVRSQEPFAGVHVCPASSLDVPDEQTVRLVVLSPAQSYTPSAQDCAAMQACCEILEKRGTGARNWRNMLIFLAADQAALSLLEQRVCQYLAWKSIEDERGDLNLDQSQIREAEKSRKLCDQQVNALLSNAWCWLLIPGTDEEDRKTLTWNAKRLSGNASALNLKEACSTLENEEDIVSIYAPQTLLMELDNLLWKDRDHISVKTLWEYYCTYSYLPRLTSYKVLQEAMEKGCKQGEYFAYAEACSEPEKRYIGLKWGETLSVDRAGLLVRLSVARAQGQIDKGKDNTKGNGGTSDNGNTGSNGNNGGGTIITPPPPPPGPNPPAPKTHNFFMTAELDSVRINRDVNRILEEVTSHLANSGMKLSFRLEVRGSSPDGVDQQTVRTVVENCMALKIKDFNFEE